MTDARDSVRQALKDWIAFHLERLDETPTSIAKQLGFATTTLTKFLYKDDHKFLLAAETVARLEARFGERAPSGSGQALRFVEDPQPEAMRIDASSISGALGQMLSTFLANSNSRSVFKKIGRGLEVIGIMPGDIIVVDDNVQPADGQVVCALVTDHVRKTSHICFRIYWKAVVTILTSASYDIALARPLVVDDDKVKICGVMVQRFGSADLGRVSSINSSAV